MGFNLTSFFYVKGLAVLKTIWLIKLLPLGYAMHAQTNQLDLVLFFTLIMDLGSVWIS